MKLVSFLTFCVKLTTYYSLGYENIALKKQTWQSKQYNPLNALFKSDKAVDGLKTDLSAWGGQCTISAEGQSTATWWVNLTSIYSIHDIRIYYRTDNAAWDASNGYTKRFLGFYVYISNTTNTTDGYLCFHDETYTRATIPSVADITCPIHGQYVIYSNIRPQDLARAAEFSREAHNELCEVEVNGCSKTGVYGPDCSLPCPDTNCRYCHIETGACEGCKPGYQGHQCELPCSAEFYGETCSLKCGNCSNGVTCNHVNGSCPNGCDDGVYGDKCQTPCPVGWHGNNCSEMCSNCDDCDRFSGQCTSPCKPGWKGAFCTDVCSAQFYGVNCSMACGNCTNGVTCNHINGSCTDGCDVGVYGEKCQTPCPIGWHGHNCSQMCSNCDECDRFSGHCTSPCKPGWKGPFCKSACDVGRYGQDCGQSCGACLEYKQCHHINGSCLEGCDAGFEGDNCTTACSSGKFGINCKEDCNDKCGVPYECNGTTGECEGGCQPGWEGLHCEKECRKNMYGPDCSLPCGYCLNTTCNHINGTCPYGCSNGYIDDLNCTTVCNPGKYGFRCMEKCSETCKDGICDHVNGNCVEEKENLLGGSKDDNEGIIIGGIVGGSVIASLVVATVVFLFKRRGMRKTERKDGKGKGSSDSKKMDFRSIPPEPASHPNRENTYLEINDGKPEKQQKKSDDPEVEVDEDEKIHSENPYGDFYANETMIREIPLNQLESVIAENRKNGDDGFQKEYATLPYGERYKCDAGKTEENMMKNRFKTTFPYDHSRVILKSETGSDYINANYIEGAEKDKEYIATQGPRPNTVVDFWTMIWQEHVEAIVILTNLKEGTKTKCTQYWPGPNKHTSYGYLSVKMVEEKEYAFYIIRKFSMFHKETKSKRHVTQYHYTRWPDHGTPDPLCLVIFLDHVTRIGSNQKHSPTVVHCSAGIGRTGTYIAIDVLNKKARKTGKVNIAEYVKKMRESRMNMVQTYEQYMTIFLALNEIFKSPVKSITVDEFTKKAETLTTDKVANQSALQKEFQRLMNIRPKYDDTAFKIAKESCGDIYFNGILPLDKYSVHLSSVVPKRGNFINAIIVPSHTNDIAFIVTQYPAEEDVIDFLRLLSDHESETVVCMDPLNKISSSKAWFPSSISSSKTVHPFTVQFQSKSETDVNTTIVHILQENREKKAQPVTIIEPKVSIKTSGTPLDTSQLRSLVSATLRTETENPVTIVSSDGAVLCGIFCAVHNAIQQIKMDNSVDVFTAVRQLQVRRPEFCSNIGEYRFVIKAVCDHIQSSSESIYYNQ